MLICTQCENIKNQEIINILSLASKWLLRDAIDVSGTLFYDCSSYSYYLQVLLDYGEYNEQGDVSYTIANLEGSILFILGLEIPANACIAWENSTYYSRAAINGLGKNARERSRDVKNKYSSEGAENAAEGEDGNLDDESGNYKSVRGVDPAVMSFTESSFASKPKDEHTDEDIVAMKQLGKSIIVFLSSCFCFFGCATTHTTSCDFSKKFRHLFISVLQTTLS